MSQRNVAILRGMYEAFNRGDIAAALEALDAEIEWRITPDAGPSPQTYHGHRGVRSALSSMLEVWADYQNEPLEFIPSEDWVVVRICSSARGKASGIDIEEEVAHLWRLRDGKAVRFEAHRDSAEALESARRLDGEAVRGGP